MTLEKGGSASGMTAGRGPAAKYGGSRRGEARSSNGGTLIVKNLSMDRVYQCGAHLARSIASSLPALLWAARLAAQVPEGPPADTTSRDSNTVASDTASTAEEPEPSAPWRTSYYPYLTGGANDGPVLAFRVHHFQPAEYDARVTTRAALTGETGITPRGGRHVILRFRAPQLWTNWRVKALAAAVREVRFGYFGLGNETTDEEPTANQPFLHRVRRTRYGGQLEVTRRVRGPLQVALQGNVEWTRFTTLPESSRFDRISDPS